jgi:hypothetical protein
MEERVDQVEGAKISRIEVAPSWWGRPVQGPKAKTVKAGLWEWPDLATDPKTGAKDEGCYELAAADGDRYSTTGRA